MGLRRGMLSSLDPPRGARGHSPFMFGAFQKKSSLMNIQPMSKQKFVRSEPASVWPGGAATPPGAPLCCRFFSKTKSNSACPPAPLGLPVLYSALPLKPSSHRRPPLILQPVPCKQPSQCNSTILPTLVRHWGVALLEADRVGAELGRPPNLSGSSNLS